MNQKDYMQQAPNEEYNKKFVDVSVPNNTFSYSNAPYIDLTVGEVLTQEKIDSIGKLISDNHKRLVEKLVGELKEQLGKPHPAEMMFEDCPKCDQKVNRDWLTQTITGVRDDGLICAISSINQTLK